MSKRKWKRKAGKITNEGAFQLVETALEGRSRERILDEALKSGNFREALQRLRIGMLSHSFETASDSLALGGTVNKLDRKTRQEGIYVLHVWHHDSHRFLKGITPVLMLDHFARSGSALSSEKKSLAILLDYYFLNVLALLAVRAWDEGDANANLDRVTRLIGYLQGTNGSGFQFVENAETLLLLAISQYHPNEQGYDHLLKRVWILDEIHQLGVALVMAAFLGSHLRWGFRGLYKRDLARMRDDNVVDYPWLLFSMLTLLRRFSGLREGEVESVKREQIVEALLNGLTPDPLAVIDEPPDSLSQYRKEHSDFRELCGRYGKDLLEEFQQHRPSTETYSPISLCFNFPHNALVGMIAIELFQGPATNLPLNALLTREKSGRAVQDSPEIQARALMDFSSRPERLDTKGAVQIVYDPEDGLRSFTETMLMLKQHWT